MPDTIRAFVAVDLPDGHREALADHLRVCAEAAPGLRWVTPQNLHLTLRFLGNLAPERVAAVVAGLRGVSFAPFDLRLAGAGSFGRGRAVRVVWLGLQPPAAELAALAAGVASSCREAGLEPETRPYNPHLTLARARDRKGSAVPPLPSPPDLPAWTVLGFRLYRSLIGPGGAVYSVIEDFPA